MFNATAAVLQPLTAVNGTVWSDINSSRLYWVFMSFWSAATAKFLFEKRLVARYTWGNFAFIAPIIIIIYNVPDIHRDLYFRLRTSFHLWVNMETESRKLQWHVYNLARTLYLNSPAAILVRSPELITQKWRCTSFTKQIFSILMVSHCYCVRSALTFYVDFTPADGKASKSHVRDVAG